MPLSVVHRTPQCASKTILLPDENPRAQPLTKSGILENQFGHSMWLNRKMSKKLVDGMSDELCNAVIEALEAIRICHKPSRCAERVPVPNTVHGVTLKVLDDDVSVHAYCVEELNLDACKPCGIHFNRKFAEDIMGCRSEELLTRIARGDVSFPTTEMEFLCTLMDSFTRSEGMRYHRYHIITPGLITGHQQRSSLLVRQEYHVKMDFNTGIAKVEATLVPVSAEEYDRARLSDPNVCRPFLAQIGDLRSSKQLLRDRSSDVRVTFAKVNAGANTDPASHSPQSESS